MPFPAEIPNEKMVGNMIDMKKPMPPKAYTTNSPLPRAQQR